MSHWSLKTQTMQLQMIQSFKNNSLITSEIILSFKNLQIQKESVVRERFTFKMIQSFSYDLNFPFRVNQESYLQNDSVVRE